MRREKVYTSSNSRVFKSLGNTLWLFATLLLFESNLHAQVLVQYDAANYNAAPLNSLSASGCSSGLATYSTLQISAASTTPYGYCAGRFAFCGYFQITAKSQPGYAYCSAAAPSLSTTPDYLTFTVTPNTSNCLFITQFNITMGTYSTGGDKVLVGYSNDGGVTWVAGPTFILPHTTAGGGQTGTGNCGAATAPGANCATMKNYTWNITPFSSATPVIFKIIPYDATTCDCTTGANGNHEWACTQVEVDGTVAPLPTITVTNPPACAGSSVSLTVAGASTYTWNTGSTANPLSVIATNTTYTVTGTSVAGCTNTAVTTLAVNPSPTVTVNSPSACSGTSVNLTATGANTYTWNTGSNATTINVTPGATSYTVTGTSATGCTNTAIANVTVNPPPTITVNNPTICSGTSVNLNAGGANTYTWNTGSNLATINVTPGATSYTVTGTSAVGCTNTAVANVTVNTPPTVTVNNPTICSGTSVNLTATGANTYTWNTGSTANPLNVMPGATSYTVTGTSAAGCTNTAVANVTVNMPPTVTVNNPTICSGSSVNLTAAGANTYTWNTGSNATNINVTPGATSYTVTGTSAAGCTNTAVANVTVNTPPTVTVNSPTICSGSSINLTAGGASTYTWNTGSSSNPLNVTPGATSYTVTGTSAVGCTNTAVSSITINTLAVTVTSTSVACGATNGTAAATVIGGVGPFTYSWSPTGGTAANASGLSSGIYSVKVTDSQGCTSTGTVAVTGPTSSFTASATGTPVTCNGGANGSATVTIVGGLAPFTYTWSPSGGNAATANGLSAGAYVVSINDANGCNGNTNVTITQPTAFTVTAGQGNILCNAGTTTASVSVSGGNPLYTYTWLPSGGNVATSSAIAAGNYTVNIKDANNCNTSHTFNIIQPTALNIAVSSTSVSCGGTNGTAAAVVTGGTSPYTYTWSPIGGNAANASGLSGGIYTVAILDANACASNATVQVTQPVSFTATATSTSVTCNGAANGTASITVAGGTGPFIYNWSPSGGNAVQATALTAGNYQATVTDPTGCSTVVPVNITQPSSLTVTTVQGTILCNAGTTTASVNVSGGTSAYTYTWSPSGGNSSIALGLTAGNYTVLVSDINSCTTTATANIAQPSAILLTPATASITCNGTSTGVAIITALGGTPGYTYTWSPGGGNASSATGLDAGNYTVSVLDHNSCPATTTLNIIQANPITPTVSGTAASCNLSNGTATLTVSGGTPGYTYTWSPIGGNNLIAAGLTGGSTYSIAIEDANNCVTSTQVTIASNSSINLAVSSAPATCGISNGTVTAIATGGAPAQSGYAYTWTPNVSLNNSASNLAPGVYSISAGDSLGCVTTKTITVGNKPSPVLSVTSNSVACFGASTGSAVVNINAGTGTAPFTYSWTPIGGAGSTTTNLAMGNYTVTVVDSANCKAIAAVNINQPPALTVMPSSTLASCGNSNGMASCIATGGTPGYTYTWSPTGGNASSTTNLAGNITYTVAVSDANNCTQTTSTLVGQTSAIVLSVSAFTNATCFGTSTGAATVAATGGTPATYIYSWVPAGGANTISTGLAAGVYTINVHDANLCTATTTVNIQQPPPLTASVNSQTICAGQQTTLTSNVSGGNGAPVTYTWNPANTNTQSITISPALTTTYIVTLQNIGCAQITQACGFVNVYPVVTLSLTPADSICKGKQTILSAQATGGNGGIFTYNWNTGQIGSVITVSPNIATIYTVTASDALCPPVTATTQVGIYSNPTLTLSSTPTSSCGFVCVDFEAYATNIVGNNIVPPYKWIFGDGSTASGTNVGHCYNNSGNFNVTLTALTQNNCIDTLQKFHYIHVNPNPVADFSASTFTTDINDGVIHFYNLSSHNVISWDWFTDGSNYTTINPSHTYLYEGTYPVTLIVKNAEGCSDTITKDVTIIPYFTFYAPNCATPNGDGINEKFLPLGMGWNDNTYRLWIYDRWGLLIFYTSDPNQGWDCTVNNHIVQEDTYVWKVTLSDVFSNPHEYHGQISVVR